MIIPATLDRSTRTGWPLVSTLPPLAALPTAPGTARAHVGAVLAHWQMSALADLAELIATELVTNALRASTTPAGGPCYVNGRVALIWVCLMSDGLRALIEVHDRAEGAPVLRDAGPYAETGRGLHLIDALTGGDWGWYSKRPQPGKCVWAVISLDGETVPQLTALTPAGRREPFTAVPASFRP